MLISLSLVPAVNFSKKGVYNLIDLEKLKPIIQPLLTEDNTESVIKAIMEIDEKPKDDSDIDALIAEKVKEAEDAAKSDYNKRLREMFFGGEKPDENHENQKQKPIKAADFAPETIGELENVPSIESLLMGESED